MSNFLPISLQNFLHGWQSGLSEVSRKDSSPMLTAWGLICIAVGDKGPSALLPMFTESSPYFQYASGSGNIGA